MFFISVSKISILLLLATKGDTQIVGVPGCARSLKPSGFDWVLETGMAFTIPPFEIISLKIFNFTSSDLKILVTFTSSIGFLNF